MDMKPEVRSRPSLTADDRLYLIQTINALPPTQFDELVYALNPPSGIIPGDSAPQGKQAKALLDWIESPSGCGLQKLDDILVKLVKPTPQAASQYLAFTIRGRIETLSLSELDGVVQYLREVTGDDSINLSFYGEGSIKLVLAGSEQGLERLQELFKAGELTAVPGDRPVESVGLVDERTTAERKTRLIQTLQFREKAAHSFARARDLAHDLARDLDLLLPLAIALDNARTLVLALTRALDSALVLSLVLSLASDLDSALSRASASDLNLASDLASDLDNTLVLARDFAINLDTNLTSDLDCTVNNTRLLARTLASAIASLPPRGEDLDLSELDLSGANLRKLVLTGADLTGTNFDHALVEGTVFGDNPGLAEADKDDLQSRGAIFQDSPGSDVAVRVPVPAGR